MAKRDTKKNKKPKEPSPLVVRVSERRKELYDKAAESADLYLSEWVRRVLDTAADEELGK